MNLNDLKKVLVFRAETVVPIVGIGTATPYTALEVRKDTAGGTPATSGSVDANVGLRMRNTAVVLDTGVMANGNTWIQNRNYGDYSINYPLLLNPNGGNVGIGLTNPTYQLQLSADSAAKPGTSTWTIASDERLKDIRAPFTRGLDALNGLNTVYFNYKKDNPLDLPSGKEYVGIKAQDAQRVIPEAVSTDEQGYLHVTNDSIIWTAVNAIKELYSKFLGHDREIASIKAEKADKAEMEALKAKNQRLEQENIEMKARRDKIEKMLNSK